MEVNIKEYKKLLVYIEWISEYIQIDREINIKTVVIVENEQDDEEKVYTI